MATVVAHFDYALLGSSVLGFSKGGEKDGFMANHSKHQVDWFSGICIAAIVIVSAVTFIGFFFLPSSGLVEEPKVKVEVISSASEELATPVTNGPATDEVVGKLIAVASVTNREPVEIEFSVRPRLANGETNVK